MIVLENELLQLRETLSADPGAHRQMVDELLRALRTRSEQSGPDAVELLVATAGSDGERRAALTDIVGTIARRLAPEDEPPVGSDTATVWRMLVAIADRLHGSGVAVMGRLPFISDRLLELMVAEAREQLPERPGSGPRRSAKGGRALAGVAVSGKLKEAIGAARLPCAIRIRPAGVARKNPPRLRRLRAHLPPGPRARSACRWLRRIGTGRSSTGSGRADADLASARRRRRALRPGHYPLVAEAARGRATDLDRRGPEQSN
jgi:hypothetical protein